MKCPGQLVRLQFIGLLLYSIAKFIKITKFHVFKDVNNIMCMWPMDLWTGTCPGRTSLLVVFHLHQQKTWGKEGFYCSLCKHAVLYLWPKSKAGNGRLINLTEDFQTAVHKKLTKSSSMSKQKRQHSHYTCLSEGFCIQSSVILISACNLVTDELKKHKQKTQPHPTHHRSK